MPRAFARICLFALLALSAAIVSSLGAVGGEPAKTATAAKPASEKDLARPIPENAQVTRFTRFNLRYTLRDVVSNAVQKVEFYITDDMGKTWRYYGEDPDKTSPMTVEVPGEGVYGFVCVATDRFGNREREPRPNTKPESVVVVDRTPPTAKWLAPRQDIIGKGPSIEFEWETGDAHFAANPVKIQYAVEAQGNHDRGANWLVMKDNLPAKGKTSWTPPSGQKYNFRLIAEDRAGNVTVAYCPATIKIDNTPPYITSVKPLRSKELENDIVVEAKDNDGGSGLKEYSLYVSENGGYSWTLLKETVGGDSLPIKRASGQAIAWKAPKGGDYPLWPVVFDAAGNATPLPAVGVPGPYVLTIDNEPPVVTLSSSFLQGQNAILANEQRLVEWTGYDPHIMPNTGKIHLSLDNGKTWQELATYLPATGSEMVFFPFGARSEEAKLKVTVEDEYGNIGQSVSDTFKLSSGDTTIDSVTPKSGPSSSTSEGGDIFNSTTGNEFGLGGASGAGDAAGGGALGGLASWFGQAGSGGTTGATGGTGATPPPIASPGGDAFGGAFGGFGGGASDSFGGGASRDISPYGGTSVDLYGSGSPDSFSGSFSGESTASAMPRGMIQNGQDTSRTSTPPASPLGGGRLPLPPSGGMPPPPGSPFGGGAGRSVYDDEDDGGWEASATGSDASLEGWQSSGTTGSGGFGGASGGLSSAPWTPSGSAGSAVVGSSGGFGTGGLGGLIPPPGGASLPPASPSTPVGSGFNDYSAGSLGGSTTWPPASDPSDIAIVDSLGGTDWDDDQFTAQTPAPADSSLGTADLIASVPGFSPAPDSSSSFGGFGGGTSFAPPVAGVPSPAPAFPAAPATSSGPGISTPAPAPVRAPSGSLRPPGSGAPASTPAAPAPAAQAPAVQAPAATPPSLSGPATPTGLPSAFGGLPGAGSQPGGFSDAFGSGPGGMAGSFPIPPPVPGSGPAGTTAAATPATSLPPLPPPSASGPGATSGGFGGLGGLEGFGADTSGSDFDFDRGFGGGLSTGPIEPALPGASARPGSTPSLPGGAAAGSGTDSTPGGGLGSGFGKDWPAFGDDPAWADSGGDFEDDSGPASLPAPGVRLPPAPPSSLPTMPGLDDDRGLVAGATGGSSAPLTQLPPSLEPNRRPANPRRLSNDYVKESKTFREQGRPDLAEDSATKALDADKSNAAAYMELSQVNARKDPPDYVRAANLAKEATGLQADWETWWNCADIFYIWAHATNREIQAVHRSGQTPLANLIDERNSTLNNALIAINNAASVVNAADRDAAKKVAVTQGMITYLRALTVPDPVNPGEASPGYQNYLRERSSYKGTVTPMLLEAMPFFQKALSLGGAPEYNETFQMGIINFRLAGLERDTGNAQQASTYYQEAVKWLEEATTARNTPADGPREAYYMLALCHDQLAGQPGANQARHRELALRYWRQTADFYDQGSPYRTYAEQRIDVLAEEMGL